MIRQRKNNIQKDIYYTPAHEIGIDDYNDMIVMFTLLDFKKTIVVEKVRNSWEDNGIIISFDTINNLGTLLN